MKLSKLVRIFSAALVLAGLVGTAQADVAFTTSDYQTGRLGIIGMKDKALSVLSNRADFGGDTIAFSYSDGSRLLVAERRDSVDDSVYIYNPANLSSPLKNFTWAGIRNIYDIEYFGYLYVICYDTATVAKVNSDSFDITATYKIADAHNFSSGFTPHGVSITRLGDHYYALFVVDDGKFPASYEKSLVVKLDDNLKEVASWQVTANAHSIFSYSGSLYIASWGGPQVVGGSAGGISRLERVTNTTTGGVKTIFTGNDIDGGQIASVYVTPNGSTLVATHTYDANFNTTANIYLLGSNMSAANKIKLKTLSGWSTKIIYDRVLDRFWVASASGKSGANQLIAFDPGNGTEVASFSSSNLGGPAYFVAPVKQVGSSGSSDDDDGGGCATGSLGLVLAMSSSLLFILRRR